MMATRRSTSAAAGAALAVATILPPAATAQDETVLFYHADAIGSVRMITDAGAQVVARYDFLPFGEPWNPAAEPDVRQFAGKERDAETGLTYFGARYYRTGDGRFTAVDPALDIPRALLEPQQWNRYAYVSNNPLRKVDPTGAYEVDVHLYLTQVLARAAGIRPDVADRIARSDQGVDAGGDTGPFASRSARERFHFTSEERRRALWAAFEASGSPEALGVFFHAQQDSFAHQGYGPTLGHLLAGHGPDRTYESPATADRMARDTYDRLRLAAPWLQSGAPTPESWEAVSPFVSRFNRAKTIDEKRRILEELAQMMESEQ